MRSGARTREPSMKSAALRQGLLRSSERASASFGTMDTPTAQPPQLLDAAGAAGLLGIALATFERCVEPELARVRIGSSFRYDRQDLLAWIGAHKVLGPDATPATSEFLTRGEAARFLRVDVRTLSRWESEGRLKGVKLTAGRQGRKVFRRAEIDRFVRDADGG